MKTAIRTLVLVSSLALLATSAYAAGAGRSACKQDVQTYCSDVQRGDGRIVKCLKEHEKDLSSQCSEALGKLKDRKGSKDGEGSGDNDSGSSH